MLCRRWYLLRKRHYLKSNTLLNEIWPCIKHCPRTLPLPCVIMMIRFIFRTQWTEGHQLWYSGICQSCESFASFLRHHTVHYGGNNTAYKLTTKRPHERSLFFVVVKYCKIRAKDNKNLSKKITKFLFTSVPFSINSTVSFSSSVICSMIQGDSLSLVPPNFSTKKKTVKHPL